MMMGLNRPWRVPVELAWHCAAASIVPADARILSSTECKGAAAAEDRGAYRLTTCG